MNLSSGTCIARLPDLRAGTDNTQPSYPPAVPAAVTPTATARRTRKRPGGQRGIVAGGLVTGPARSRGTSRNTNAVPALLDGVDRAGPVGHAHATRRKGARYDRLYQARTA